MIRSLNIVDKRIELQNCAAGAASVQSNRVAEWGKKELARAGSEFSVGDKAPHLFSQIADLRCGVIASLATKAFSVPAGEVWYAPTVVGKSLEEAAAGHVGVAGGVHGNAKAVRHYRCRQGRWSRPAPSPWGSAW